MRIFKETIIKCKKCGEKFDDVNYSKLTLMDKNMPKRIYCNKCVEELWRDSVRLVESKESVER